MTIVSILAIVAFCWMSFRRGRVVFGKRCFAWIDSRRWIGSTCAIALGPLSLAQSLVLLAQVRAENGGPFTEWQKHLPVPVYDGRTSRGDLHALFSLEALLVGLAETLCVGAVALAVRHDFSPRLRRAMIVATILLAIVALGTPAMSTTDPYEYAATSILGMRAYAPTAAAFAQTPYAPFFHHVPLAGVIYGPLWVLINFLELALIPTIVGKIIALRVLNVFCLAATAYVLKAAKCSPTVVAALVVNPAIWYYVVLNPHADIDGILLLAVALLASRKSRYVIASLLIAAAGLIKLPFLIAGVVLLVPASRPRRYALCTVAAAIVAAASLLVPHNAYIGRIAFYVPTTAALNPTAQTRLWMVVSALAIFNTFGFAFFDRRGTATPWLFNQLAPLGAPWYLLWGLPYAIVTGTATLFFVSLPIAAVALDYDFDIASSGSFVIAIAVVLAVADLVRSYRTRDASAITYIL